MTSTTVITSPESAALDDLCQRLAGAGGELDRAGRWPEEQLRWCAEFGVFEWFVPEAWGGQNWSAVDIVRGYLRLSAACLTTTFIITQLTGAARRIVGSDNEPLQERLLPGLVRGEHFATLGVSHLTTSRRHLASPVLRAELTPEIITLDGYSPWVTGSAQAAFIVMGGTCDDGRQLLVAMPTDLAGVSADEPVELIGLTASYTGQVRMDHVEVGREWLLDGPADTVMIGGVGGGTGGLQTSTLALGLASAAIDFLSTEAEARDDLLAPMGALRAEFQEIKTDLLATAAGSGACTTEDLRSRANSLVLRAVQAALAAAKGAGYVVGHPAGRWCREALFFLVWSCPQGVVAANLCELAGIEAGSQ